MQTESSNPMLQAIDLTKKYDDGVLGLDQLNLAVERNQIYALLGGNGAGKTTTINLFLNFIDPTSGEARVDGVVTHQDPLAAKTKLSYVSENVMLYPNFTALQNLEFFARLGGRTDITERALTEALDRVGLQKEAHRRRLRDFSKGMRQKCGIAIAILKNSPAILLDEPTSGLDPKAGQEFIYLLTSLREEGHAILMSTHDIFRARQVADKIGIMNEGKLVAEKTSKELEGEDLEKIYIEYMTGHAAAEA